MRPGAKYVSAVRHEYYINPNGNYFTVHKYRGGKVPRVVEGNFTTFREAETRLINWLKQTDKFGNRARYPGRDG